MAEPFKNFIDAAAVDRLVSQFEQASADFDGAAFRKAALDGLEGLELKDRVRHLAACLRQILPAKYSQALRLLLKALPKGLQTTDELSLGWEYWALAQFVEDYGREHAEESLDALQEITQVYTAEFAIRPYVDRYPELAFAKVRSWLTSPNPHVRRLCSEGLRPRLPWGMRLQGLVDEPSPLWPILEALKDDEELYVRRSVANCINDIAKDHPDEVVAKVAKWRGTDSYVLRHGLRSLVKSGHTGALELLGFGEPIGISVELALPGSVSIGGALPMKLRLTSTHSESQRLAVDYAVHYLKNSGKNSAKVFKWKTLDLPAGGSVELGKSQSFAITSVRVLRPGTHAISILVNGVKSASQEFLLDNS